MRCYEVKFCEGFKKFRNSTLSSRHRKPIPFKAISLIYNTINPTLNVIFTDFITRNSKLPFYDAVKKSTSPKD